MKKDKPEIFCQWFGCKEWAGVVTASEKYNLCDLHYHQFIKDNRVLKTKPDTDEITTKEQILKLLNESVKTGLPVMFSITRE